MAVTNERAGPRNGLEALHHTPEVKTVVVDFDAAPPADPFD